MKRPDYPSVFIVLHTFVDWVIALTFGRLIPAGNCMFKVNNGNTRTRCEICSKLTIKTAERCN